MGDAIYLAIITWVMAGAIGGVIAHRALEHGTAPHPSSVCPITWGQLFIAVGVGAVFGPFAVFVAVMFSAFWGISVASASFAPAVRNSWLSQPVRRPNRVPESDPKGSVNK